MLVALLAFAALLAAPGVGVAADFPAGFDAQPLPAAGLTAPTAMAFAPDGSYFVAEKSGRVKRFSGIADASAGTLVVDLSAKVHDFSDRGLLGLALDPGFPAVRRLYVLYTAETALPGTRTFPDPGLGSWNDDCPAIPGADTAGCVVSAKLSRIDLTTAWAGTETELIRGWCQQFSSHSIGTLAFGRDGMLYAGGGDGASYIYADYGQAGGGGGNNPPRNPCGDPPVGIDGVQTEPSAEGGALRSQDLRTPDDPTGLNGTIIRVDPATGAAAPGNPLTTGDSNRRRIIAYGMRNPFRFAPRPGTDELWVGDVGWDSFEEVDRIADVGDDVVENFGWPCREGPAVNYPYSVDRELTLCRTLEPEAATEPRFSYRHDSEVVAGDGCEVANGASVGPVGFYPGGSYPAGYSGSLFFGDYSRGCLWTVPIGTSGEPDFARTARFAHDLVGVVDLKPGPNGDLYLVDAFGGTISRVRYTPGNAAPTPRITTVAPYDRTEVSAPPLEVDFDGSTSSDPDDPALTYAWDLDGDGAFDDSTAADPPRRTYAQSGTFTVKLKVTDPAGVSRTTSRLVRTNNAPPVPAITVQAGQPYRVGETVKLAGTATDPETGALPASALHWTIELRHCNAAGGCHTHPVKTFDGVAAPSFAAFDHPWPSYHVVTLRATDSAGASATTSVDVRPRESHLAVRATVGGAPVEGLGVRVDDEPQSGAPVSRSEGQTVTLATTEEQSVGLDDFVFAGWSNGPAGRTQVLPVPAGSTTIDARFHQAARNLAPPTLAGTAREGDELTAGLGTWAGEPAPALTVQWERCASEGVGCSPIAGATQATLRPAAAEVGSLVRVVVRGENGVKAARTVRSAAVGPVVARDAAAPALPAAPGPTPVPAGPLGPALDVTPPNLRVLSAARARTAPRLGVRVTCFGEPCRATVRPILVSAGRRALALEPIAASLPRGVPARLEVRLGPKRRADIRARLRRGLRPRMTFQIEVRDTAGNPSRAARSVVLRP